MTADRQNRLLTRLQGGAVRQFCRSHAIRKLELFGSVARGENGPGSDVDLIATFDELPVFELDDIHHQLSELLGVSVDFLTDGAVASITNPFRKNSIMKDRRVVYER